MISIKSSADMARALASPIDVNLKRLLTLRRDQLFDCGGYDLGELTHFIIVEAGDTMAVIEGAAGVALATNLVDNSRFGDPDFVDNFEFVELHIGWFEAVIILSDDGFGVALFVPDCPNTDPALLALVRDRR